MKHTISVSNNGVNYAERETMKQQNKEFETGNWEDPDGTNGQQVFAEKAISNVFSRCGLEVPSNIHVLAAKCLSAAIEVAGPNPSQTSTFKWSSEGWSRP